MGNLERVLSEWSGGSPCCGCRLRVRRLERAGSPGQGRLFVEFLVANMVPVLGGQAARPANAQSAPDPPRPMLAPPDLMMRSSASDCGSRCSA